MALDKDDVIQVKEAFKWIMQGQVAKELGGVAVVTRVGDPHKEEEKKVYVKEDVLIIINWSQVFSALLKGKDVNSKIAFCFHSQTLILKALNSQMKLTLCFVFSEFVRGRCGVHSPRYWRRLPLPVRCNYSEDLDKAVML